MCCAIIEMGDEFAQALGNEPGPALVVLVGMYNRQAKESELGHLPEEKSASDANFFYFCSDGRGEHRALWYNTKRGNLDTHHAINDFDVEIFGLPGQIRPRLDCPVE